MPNPFNPETQRYGFTPDNTPDNLVSLEMWEIELRWLRRLIAHRITQLNPFALSDKGNEDYPEWLTLSDVYQKFHAVIQALEADGLARFTDSDI